MQTKRHGKRRGTRQAATKTESAKEMRGTHKRRIDRERHVHDLSSTSPTMARLGGMPLDCPNERMPPTQSLDKKVSQ